MFGDQRQMVLHYFLADDTIEIREVRGHSVMFALSFFPLCGSYIAARHLKRRC
jgi:hypothetical protein